MKRTAGILALIAAAGFSAGALAAPTKPTAKLWTFESSKVGEAPAGFMLQRTGSGPDGRWVIEQEKGAPSGKHVLAQLDGTGAKDRTLIAIANEPTARDLTLSVRAKVVSGKMSEDSGLVFRYQDDKNYYVARANELKHDIALFAVKDGKSNQIAEWHDPRPIKGNWHGLTVMARGDHIQVLWDGKRVLDAHDKTFAGPGKAGVWTYADSVTYYDNLHLRPLA